MQPKHHRSEKSEVGNENCDDYLLSDFVVLLCTVPMNVLQQKCLETKCLVKGASINDVTVLVGGVKDFVTAVLRHDDGGRG